MTLLSGAQNTFALCVGEQNAFGLRRNGLLSGKREREREEERVRQAKLYPCRPTLLVYSLVIYGPRALMFYAATLHCTCLKSMLIALLSSRPPPFVPLIRLEIRGLTAAM